MATIEYNVYYLRAVGSNERERKKLYTVTIFTNHTHLKWSTSLYFLLIVNFHNAKNHTSSPLISNNRLYSSVGCCMLKGVACV